MKNFLCRLFNLYPGEERNAFLFAFLALCWSFGSNLGFKYSDALLLIHVGAAALPTVYILSACGMIIPAVLLLNTINRVGSSKIFVSILLLVAGFYLSVFFLIASGVGTDSGWLWYLLRIVSFQLDVLLITSYWTFIDKYHNMQDSKRKYVLFSLTVFCGQALTGFTMQSALLSFSSVLIVIVFTMILSLFLVRRITTSMHLAHDQGVLEEEEELSARTTFAQTVRDIAKSPFTLLLMLNNFTIFLMWVSAEYNYLSFFDMHFDPPGHTLPDGGAKNAAITLFLGKMLASVSVTNLIFGLFLYSRLIRKFGVVSLLFFTPVVIIFAMSGWLIHPVIIFPILSYIVVEGFLEVIDESNFSLLLNAVPKKLKYRVRILIESFLEPLAMLCTGLVLKVSGSHSILLCLLLAIGAFILAFVLRKAYQTAVYQNIAKNAIHFERTPIEWFSRMTPEVRRNEIEQLFNILKTGKSVEERLFAAKSILSLNDPLLLPKLMEISKELSPEYQISLLEYLDDSPLAAENSVKEHLLAWLTDLNHQDVIASTKYLLARQGLLHPENVYQDLEQNQPTLKGAAIITLKQFSEHLTPHALLQNRAIADEHLQKMLKSTDLNDLRLAIELLGEEGSNAHYALLISFLNHPSRLIRHEAIASYAKIATPQCRQHAKLIIGHLRRSEDTFFRRECLKALGKIGDPTLIRDILDASKHLHQSEIRLTETIVRKMGLAGVPTLLTITKNTSMPDRCRALAGRILGHLALSHLHANLKEIIDIELERASFYYYYYHTIQQRYPDKDLSLLVEALQTGYHSVMDFMIQILSTAGEVEDCDLISRLFRSKSSKVRSQVVEMLEKTCDPKIFKTLRPFLEDVPPQEIFNSYLRNKKELLTLEQLLIILQKSSSHVDQIVSVTLMQEINAPHWKEALNRLLSSNEPIFRHFARELIESCNN